MILENKKFYIFLILILSFFYFKNAKATEYVDIENLYPNRNLVLTLYNHDWIKQGFVPSAFNISKLVPILYSAYEPGQYQIKICKGDVDSVTSFFDCSNSELIASTTVQYPSNWNFDLGNIKLIPNDKYYFSVQYHDHPSFPGTPGNLQFLVNNGNARVGNSYFNGTSTNNAYSIKFRTYYSDVIIPDIKMELPKNLGTYKDFAFWQLFMSLPATTSQITLEVHYGDDSSPTQFNDTENVSALNGTANINWSMEKHEKLDQFLTTKINYIADLLAEDENGNVYFLATDTGYFFYDPINGVDTFPVQELGYFASSTYDHICDDVATSTGSFFDDFRFGIECGFKKIIYWAISPSASSLNSIKSSYDTFKQQFPFSAYFGLTDTISKAISTSTATTGTLKMPMIDKTGNYYMLDVMSSSTLPNVIGGTNANLFRNSISWAMWCAVGFMVFITFKKI